MLSKINVKERGEFMRRTGPSDEETQQTRSVRRKADEDNCERKRRASIEGSKTVQQSK